VCHDQPEDDLLLLLALPRGRLRLHVLRLPRRGGAHRRVALLLRQRVRL
jgi:hypothetical protein